jgi:hypothetical protein
MVGACLATLLIHSGSLLSLYEPIFAILKSHSLWKYLSFDSNEIYLRKNMKIRNSAVAILATASLILGPAAMASDTTPPPGPKDLTWAQLTEIKRNPSLPLSSGPMQDSRVAAPSCTVNTNNIYMRTSGSVYSFGAVGIKPKLTCTAIMPFISMSTTLYKETWWGLQFETGPVLTSGSLVRQVESKNIEKECLGNSDMSTFYAITTSRMTFPNGSQVSGNVYQENSVPCVTF